jgi:hypothetical protein
MPDVCSFNIMAILSPLANAPQAENRRPLTLAALLVPLTIYVLVLYYASNKRLFPYRNIFVPISLFTIWETCTKYAVLDPRFNVLNFLLGAAGCTLAMKLAAIITLKHPLKRKSEVECPRSDLFSFRQLIDAIDYSFDLRGLVSVHLIIRSVTAF